MAAMHFAEHLGDESEMLCVAQIADEQSRFIDSLTPPHWLSSLGADSRGHEAVFQLMARIASTKAKVLHHKSEHQDQHKALRQDEPSGNE